MQGKMVQPFKPIFEEAIFKFLFKFNFRKMWTIEEDVQLFSESLENPKKWSHIARKMVFRNSHQIKNRFICVVSKELNMKSQKVRELINENCLLSPIFMVLAKLKQKKEEEEIIKKIEKEKKNQILEKNIGKINNSCSLSEMFEMNIDKFINFRQESQNSVYFD